MAAAAAGALLSRTALSDPEAAEVQALVDLCNRSEGLDLKISFGRYGPQTADTANAFLYRAGGVLAGYGGLDPGQELEFCPLVHPAYRRRGIGRRLLAAARAEARRRGASGILLICEEASPAGQAFTASTGAAYVFSEYHMALAALHNAPAAAVRLQVRVAGPADAAAIADITAAAFGDLPDGLRERIAADLQQANQRFYLAALDGVPIGSLKVYSGEQGAGIYAFGVRPGDRGQGWGRQILSRVCAELLAAGRHPITLEVDSANEPALALYRSSGFVATTTYGYFRLAATPATA